MMESEKEECPWGTFNVIDSSDAFKVKRIEGMPDKRLSYRRHSCRSQYWFVVAGKGVVTINGNRSAVSVHSAIDIPLGVAHRIKTRD
jgi:mannose-6-phosphate isomerase-like protein (cupin superfamily)